MRHADSSGSEQNSFFDTSVFAIAKRGTATRPSIARGRRNSGSFAASTAPASNATNSAGSGGIPDAIERSGGAAGRGGGEATTGIGAGATARTSDRRQGANA